jgi:hypothetical protein
MESISEIPTAEDPHPNSEGEPSVEERRALILRLAASEQLSRSARLRDFLLYVGKQSLKDGCPEINEQEVGAKVFGRQPTYDRSLDNIVRVNATELRKRIESYFATTGAHESLILEIPRGGYKPIFRRRLSGIKPLSEPLIEEARPSLAPHADAYSVAPSRLSRCLSHFLWAGVCVGLAITSIVLLQRNRAMRQSLHPWETKPAVAAFWADFLEIHRETDIVLPDSSVGLSEEITQHPIALDEYLNHEYIPQIKEADLGQDRRSDLARIFSHNLVTFGDVHAAQQIFALDPASTSLHLTVSRFFEADLLKRNNVVLIGGKKANPWVYIFDNQMNFTLDSQGMGMLVDNRRPQPGEQATYVGSTNSNTVVGYSVVAYLPNPSRTGNAIIFAGTDSDATSAAAEFLTSEDQLEKFRNTLHIDRFPYFEVLLKTYHLRGTSFNAEVVAYRTYPGLH